MTALRFVGIVFKTVLAAMAVAALGAALVLKYLIDQLK